MNASSPSKTLRIVLFARLGIFILILAVSLLTALLQPGFFNYNWLSGFMALLSLAFLEHIFLLQWEEKLIQNSNWFLLSFCFDAFLISILVSLSTINQSLFPFLQLLNVLLAGLVLQTKGALIVALVTSICFTTSSILGPELKFFSHIFYLVFNNIAFFSVAALGGYFSDQLESVGEELERTGLSLKALQELNEATLENLPVGVVTFTQDAQILSYNRSFSIIAKGAANNCLEEILTHLPVNWAESNDKKIEFDYSRTVEEEQQLIHFKMQPIDNPIGTEALFLGIAEDLTQIRQLEYSVRQNEKMAAVGQLAAGIAHEIRNPLAGISGSIEMLSQTSSSEDDRKLMKIVLREIDRLNNLITEFLDYSRPEKPPTEQVDLVPLINEIIESLKLNSKLRSDVELRKLVIDRAVILGHKDKLKQAFLNILINSYQAMSECPSPQLVVAVQLEKDSVLVKFKDNGCGMSEETRKRMFEPFHTTKPKGTGLGLAVTHKILEGHRAQIFVESEKGIGTEFSLRFPKAP